jgi:hypothetical protein
MGGKSNPISIPSPRGGAWAAQEEPMQTAAAAAKVVAAGVVAAGRGTRPCVALRARVLFQELGIAMAAWHHSASAVRYPCLGLDCTMGQLAVIMGGLDDVVVDDVDINDVDVAGRRGRIRRLKLRSSPRQWWWQAGGGKLGGAATTTLREQHKA